MCFPQWLFVFSSSLKLMLSIDRGQWNFWTNFRKDPPHKNWTACWVKQFEITGFCVQRKVWDVHRPRKSLREWRLRPRYPDLDFNTFFFLFGFIKDRIDYHLPFYASMHASLMIVLSIQRECCRVCGWSWIFAWMFEVTNGAHKEHL